MGQITATRNLVATKVVRLAGQWTNKNWCYKHNKIKQNKPQTYHDDVIKWKHFPCYWPFVWGIHRSTVNSPHKGQWHGALMSSLICAWTNGWVNNHKAGDSRCHRTYYDIIVMTVWGVQQIFSFLIVMANLIQYLIIIESTKGKGKPFWHQTGWLS